MSVFHSIIQKRERDNEKQSRGIKRGRETNHPSSPSTSASLSATSSLSISLTSESDSPSSSSLSDSLPLSPSSSYSKNVESSVERERERERESESESESSSVQVSVSDGVTSSVNLSANDGSCTSVNLSASERWSSESSLSAHGARQRSHADTSSPPASTSGSSSSQPGRGNPLSLHSSSDSLSTNTPSSPSRHRISSSGSPSPSHNSSSPASSPRRASSTSSESVSIGASQQSLSLRMTQSQTSVSDESWKEGPGTANGLDDGVVRRSSRARATAAAGFSKKPDIPLEKLHEVWVNGGVVAAGVRDTSAAHASHEHERVGTAARVWRAESFGSHVAVKEWKGGMDGFQDEVLALRLLSHPRIVRLLGADLSTETMYLEWAPKGDLYEYGVKHGRDRDVYVSKVMHYIPQWAHQLGSALAVVHAAGIIHYDVKPANVLLSHGLSLILADFSHSMYSGTDPAAWRQLTPVVGTLQWAAPEALASGPTAFVTPASDMYAAGLTLWSTAVGMEVPYAHQGFRSQQEAATFVATERPTCVGGWPEDWRRTFARLWHRQAGKRMTAAELAATKLSSIE